MTLWFRGALWNGSSALIPTYLGIFAFLFQCAPEDAGHLIRLRFLLSNRVHTLVCFHCEEI